VKFPIHIIAATPVAAIFCQSMPNLIVSNETLLYTFGMNEENNLTSNEVLKKSPASSTPPKKKSTLKSILKEVIIFLLIAFVIFFIFRPYVAEPYVVDGASMDPTFQTGDYLIVNKLSYEIGVPERNTVIVFKYPQNPKTNFIKRIIGLPGETVKMKDNVVTIINKDTPKGFVLDQSYVVHTCNPSGTHTCIKDFEITLDNDEYFVMGDNRMDSFDSRSWGPVEEKYLLGEPILRLLPLSKISFLPGEDKNK
jgi:signal peptidase I